MKLALWGMAAVLLGSVGVYALALAGRPRPVPHVVEQVGCFEVVTHTYSYRTGWNTGPLGWGQSQRFFARLASMPGESDRLIVRPSFAPLPYRGSRTSDHGYDEYRIMFVQPAMLRAFDMRC